MPQSRMPRPARRPGFSLIEIALAVSVGLMVLGASVYTYQQISESSKFSAAKSMVGTIQTNIQMDKFRLGVAPPHTTAAPSTYGVDVNMDSVGKPYWNDATAIGTLPQDPVKGLTTVTDYDSTLSAVPLATGAPTPQWDHPIFGSPDAGKGGWLYDDATGTFRINLSNQTYPEQRPGSW